MRNKRYVFTLTEPQIKRVDDEAARMHISRSEYMRRLIDAMLPDSAPLRARRSPVHNVQIDEMRFTPDPDGSILRRYRENAQAGIIHMGPTYDAPEHFNARELSTGRPFTLYDEDEKDEEGDTTDA